MYYIYLLFSKYLHIMSSINMPRILFTILNYCMSVFTPSNIYFTLQVSSNKYYVFYYKRPVSKDSNCTFLFKKVWLKDIPEWEKILCHSLNERKTVHYINYYTKLCVLNCMYDHNSWTPGPICLKFWLGNLGEPR